MAEDKKHGDKNFSNEAKKSFLEIVSTYGKYQEMLDRKSDISKIAETLGGITEAARMLAINEADDWFDAHTVKRNMNELEKLGGQFDKVAIEAKKLDQRLNGLYEDMGHILSRYYKLGEISEEEVKSRLGMNEGKSATDHAEDILKDKKARGVEISKVISKVKNRIKTIDKQAGSRKLSDEKYKLQSLLSKLEKQKAFPREKNESVNEAKYFSLKKGDKLKVKHPTYKNLILTITKPKGNGYEYISKHDGASPEKGFAPAGYFSSAIKRKEAELIESVNEAKSPCSCGCGTCDKALTENTLMESSMAELDIIAKESKNFKEFTKEVYKEFPNLPKNKNSLKWLEDIYKTNESVNEGAEVFVVMYKIKKDLSNRNAAPAQAAYKEESDAKKFLKDVEKTGGRGMIVKSNLSKQSKLKIEAKFGYKDGTSSYMKNHDNEYQQAEKINKGNEIKFYDALEQMEDKIGHPKFMTWLSNALRGYKVDMYKDPKIKNKGEAEEALFLLSK